MIPSADVVVNAYIFLAKVNGWSTWIPRGPIENAMQFAAGFASSADEEPAALFYALARFGRALGPAWFALSAGMARNHAVTMGLVVDANNAELRALLVPIASNAMSWEFTRDWFAARLHPASTA